MISIQPALFVFAVIANLVMIRVSGIVLPDRLYFSFSAFLFDNRDLVKPLALLAKLLVPFLTAFGILALLIGLRRGRQGLDDAAPRLTGIIEDQASVTLAFAAFSAALLMAWPYILLWDLLIDPVLARQRLLFLIAYLAYFVGYAYFALAGANAAHALFGRTEGAAPVTWATLASHPVTKPLFDAAGGIVSAGLAAFLATRVGG